MTEYLLELYAARADAVDQDTERDRFMSAQEALDYGLVDKIISRHERPTSNAGGEGKRAG